MYYLRQQTRVSGPFSPEQMRTLLHKGRVARSDKISTDRVTWRAIGECPAPAAAAAEPPKPPADPFRLDDESLRLEVAVDGSVRAGPPLRRTMTVAELREALAAQIRLPDRKGGMFEPTFPVVVAPLDAAPWEAAVEVLDARRADLNDRTQQALDVVISQVRRFDQMVIDLLELSRMDVGINDLHPEPTELAPLIRRIAQRYGAGEVPVEVRGESDGVGAVDKRRFERVMANLIDNARLHGGGATRVIVGDVAPAAGEVASPPHVYVAVEDSGPGVTPSDRARIFERFARGSAGRTRAGGTGLGLALVAEHVRAHGGRTWVEDAPTGGARFVVTFPKGEA